MNAIGAAALIPLKLWGSALEARARAAPQARQGLEFLLGPISTSHKRSRNFSRGPYVIHSSKGRKKDWHTASDHRFWQPSTPTTSERTPKPVASLCVVRPVIHRRIVASCRLILIPSRLLRNANHNAETHDSGRRLGCKSGGCCLTASGNSLAGTECGLVPGLPAAIGSRDTVTGAAADDGGGDTTAGIAASERIRPYTNRPAANGISITTACLVPPHVTLSPALPGTSPASAATTSTLNDRRTLQPAAHAPALGR